MTDQQSRQFALDAIRTQRQERWKRMMQERMPDLMRDVDDGKVKLTFLEVEGLINGVFESATAVMTWGENAEALSGGGRGVP